MGAGVQQGSGLVLHIGPQVVPEFGHLVFIQIDFVGDFVHGHGAGSFQNKYFVGTEIWTATQKPVPVISLGQV
jgi:hypothetical protein